jgi:hypothetical protein
MNIETFVNSKITDLCIKYGINDYNNHIDLCEKTFIEHVMSKIHNLSTSIKIIRPIILITCKSDSDKEIIWEIINDYKKNTDKIYMFIFMNTSLIAI